MDRYAGRARLIWQANSVTFLCDEEIDVTIAAEADGWSAGGRFVQFSEEEWAGFAMLCELDPVFELAFDDGSSFWVVAHPDEIHGTFRLTEFVEGDEQTAA
ncbi:hypothetical protein BJY16_000089 [Actinoplanes octamycinicus]|uniref:Uncharacterized protein n=1 Tax=Actinoplanes octamycinicus TaxID=135948 RepID=A0A7W7GQZ5_9ACTN|nr:hypothetical protein [Actinoplanes octamycinicus]MBB4736630.1 hypothetical protein [Actinoplanes octamycinicus]